MEALELRVLWGREWLAALRRFSRARKSAAFGELVGSYVWDADVPLNDLGNEQFLASGYLSEAEAAAAANFHELLSGYANNIFEWSAWRTAADPDWLGIVDAAQATVAKLLRLSQDLEEARLLRS